ncbi:MAG TPA: RNA polymerase sigma factor [Terriglobia bacterium]|nr:RNA polymerase sigma factor [Terriglobia bacterium]
MNRMEENDAAVVAQVLAGDRDAFRVVVERHSQSLFRLAYRMTGNEQDAEDVVQETFMRAYRRLNKFEARSSFSTWLYRIAVNCSLDQSRKRRQQDERQLAPSPELPDPLLALPSTDPSSERLAMSAEVRKKVEATLNELTEKEKAAFVLRHYEGMSIEEVGRAMGLRANAAKNNIFRAVQKLRRALEPVVS